jgi:hypothetical protein
MTVVQDRVPERLRALGNPIVAPLGTAVLAVSAVSYVAVVSPEESGHYPGCPFRTVTGLYCPGCGSLRAVHAMAHGDVTEALARNPFTVLVVPYLLWVWGSWLHRVVTKSTNRYMAPAWILWLLLAAIMAFWVLRNIPGFEFLAP